MEISTPSELPCDLPVNPPDPQFPAAWCVICGQEYETSNSEYFCADCLANQDYGPFASRADQLGDEVKQLDKIISACRAEIKERMPEPSTVYRAGLEISWRQYPRQKLDIKTFRREQPAVYDRYSTTEQVDAIYITKVDMD